MFKHAQSYYPTDEKIMNQIMKEITAFQCAAVVKYIEGLNLNDKQIEALYSALAEEINAKVHTTEIA